MKAAEKRGRSAVTRFVQAMNISLLQIAPRRLDGRLRHMNVKPEYCSLGRIMWFAWFEDDFLGPHGEGQSRREAIADLLEAEES